jgi:predicted DCC family thiol-disulfide oxidoreductase YuxK
VETRRPVLLYDGDCGVCTRLAGFVVRRLRPGGAVSAYQDADLPSYGLTAEQCDAALQYVDASGRSHAAQNAVARLLLASVPWWRPLGAPLLLPGVNQLAGLVYRWVARNRSRLPGGTPACALPADQRPGAGSTT